MIKPLLFSLLVAVAGCVGADNGPAIDASSGVDGAAATGDDGGLKAFGQPCTMVSNTSTECASGVCSNSFDMSTTPLCTQRCTMLGTTDPSCPAGSQGQKCNRQGYCRP